MKSTGVFYQVLVMIMSMVKGLLVLTMLVTLGHENYALVSQFMVIASFAVQILLLNYDAPFVADLTQGTDDELTVHSAILHLITMTSLVLLVLCFVFSDLVSSWVWGSASFHSYSILLVIYAFVLVFNLRTLLLFQAMKKFNYYAFFQIAQQVLQLIAVSTGVYFGDPIVVLWLLIGMESLLWLVPIFMRVEISFTFVQIRKTLGWLKRKSGVAIPLLAVFFMLWVLNNSGRLILVQTGNLGLLAPYTASLSIALLSGLLINPLAMVFYPFFCYKDDGEFSGCYSVVQAHVTLLVFGGLVSILLIPLSNNLIALVASPDLYAGEFFFFYVCVGLLFMGFARLMTLFCAARGSAFQSGVAFFVGSSTTVAVGLYLASFMHAEGMGLAFLAGSFVAAVTLLRPFLRCSRLTRKSIRPWKIPVLWLITIALMGLSTVWASSGWMDSFMVIIVINSIYILLVIATLWQESILHDAKASVVQLIRRRID